MTEEVMFRYILKSNTEVEICGTVYIPEDEDADESEFDIEFDRAGQTPTWNLFVNHYGVGLRRTQEQDAEIEELKELFTTDDTFFQAIAETQDTNGIVEREKVWFVVNDFDIFGWLEDHLAP